MKELVYQIRLKMAAKYIDFILYKWQALIGWLSIQFYKFIFPGLKVGKEGHFWGKVLITIYNLVV